MSGLSAKEIVGLADWAGDEIARLRATNAELLAALQGCLPTLEERARLFGVDSVPLVAARNAIAKATGQSHATPQ